MKSEIKRFDLPANAMTWIEYPLITQCLTTKETELFRDKVKTERTDVDTEPLGKVAGYRSSTSFGKSILNNFTFHHHEW